MSKLFLKLAAAACAIALPSLAQAAPISGSFSLSSFYGSYIGGAQTAQTATGLDFGTGNSSGNGYGTAGRALIGNSTGSFVGLDDTFATIADISLGATAADPYSSNPFISFANSPITVNFSNASYTRSPLGTSVTVTGIATFTDGNAADTTTGNFTLATSSRDGMPNAAQFTFTGNASSSFVAVPEPMSLALLGTGLVALGIMRRKSSNA